MSLNETAADPSCAELPCKLLGEADRLQAAELVRMASPIFYGPAASGIREILAREYRKHGFRVAVHSSLFLLMQRHNEQPARA